MIHASVYSAPMMQNTETQISAAETITNQCPTCTRGKYNPYRRFDARGKVIAGCVDDFHGEHLTPISADSAWHNRKEAKAIRKRERDHLRTLKPYVG